MSGRYLALGLVYMSQTSQIAGIARLGGRRCEVGGPGVAQHFLTFSNRKYSTVYSNKYLFHHELSAWYFKIRFTNSNSAVGLSVSKSVVKNLNGMVFLRNM